MCEMVAEFMEWDNFSVRIAHCNRELDRLLADEGADLIMLDINLPGEDGLAILQRIRRTSNTPVMMLTGASDITHKMVGLDIGADDYMTKPFDLRELRSRIRAILRRHQMSAQPAPAAEKNLKPFGKVFVNLDTRCLIHADGTVEPATAMEFDLLQVFLANPDRVLTRDRLLDLAHSRGSDPFDRSIDVRITRIRKKIEPIPSKPQVLKTVRGAGYIYVSAKRMA
ncbi:two-component system response regulator [Rhizobium sp. Root268]|nr:two-component system response regulator [Rhizobium sp. Root1212]KRD36516.1 two-component system response regulator [Rhizobium sp. Root268]